MGLELKKKKYITIKENFCFTGTHIKKVLFYVFFFLQIKISKLTKYVVFKPLTKKRTPHVAKTVTF